MTDTCQKAVGQKTLKSLLTCGVPLLCLGMTFGVLYYFKAFGVGNNNDIFFLIGLAAMTAFAMMLLVTLVRAHLAKKKGVLSPGREHMPVLVMAAWGCIVIPGLSVMATVGVGTKLIASFGGLLSFLVFRRLWSRRH